MYNMKGDSTGGSTLVGYTYSYDRASRITGANFGYKSGANWQATTAYDESGYSYDGNGNILGLQRYGYNGNLMDNLTYTYTAGKNRLRQVGDAVASGLFSSDIDNQQTDNYTYDDNGNLQQDVQRDIAFVVSDIHNLPISEWKLSSGAEQRYYYDAEGKRIRKDASITEYYVNSPAGNTEAVVKSDISAATHNIWASDNIGQVKRSGTTWSRYYYLKDHLGTIKMTVNTGGTVIGKDDYYPFGMQMDSRCSASSADPRYKFTGQERDAETGYDDFGARYYDARLGRFLSVDRYEPKFPGISPFTYGANNPVLFIDMNGDSTSWNLLAGSKTHPPFSNEKQQPLGGYPGQTAAELIVAGLSKLEKLAGLPNLSFINNLIAGGSIGAPGAAGTVAGEVKTAQTIAKTADVGGKAAEEGTVVYRVFGDAARPFGRSWTTIDPGTVGDFRVAAGLPAENTGRFVIQGVLNSVEGVTTRTALRIGENTGGLPEVVIPNAASKVDVLRVAGVNPPF
jgi:RHS repeat-associated protein